MTTAPSCRCGKPAISLETKKAGPNQGRWFWKCSTASCQFFAWDNTAHSFIVHPRNTYALASPANSYRQFRRPFASAPPTPSLSTPATTLGVTGIPRSNQIQVEFSLQSLDTIRLRADYHPTLQPVLLAIQDTTWDPQTSTWSLPATIDSYKRAVCMIPVHTPNLNIQLKALPPAVVDWLQQQSSNERPGDEDIEFSMQQLETTKLGRALKDFQLEAVRKGLFFKGRVLLNDQHGLGKTQQALGLLSCYRDKWPALVICPSSLCTTWKIEIKRWLQLCDRQITTNLAKTASSAKRKQTSQTTPRKRSAHAVADTPLDDGTDISTDQDAEVQMYILSYDYAVRHVEEIAARQFQFIVCDESHLVKNREQKRRKTLKAAIQTIPHIILITAMNFSKRPFELFTQLNILRHDLFPDINPFGVRYFNGKQKIYGWDYSGRSNTEELDILLKERFAVGRTQRDVSSSLDRQYRKCILTDLRGRETGELKKTRVALSRLLSLQRQDGADSVGMAAKHQFWAKMYQETSGAKMPCVQNYVRYLLEMHDKTKIVFFAYHTSMLNIIEKVINENSIKFIRLNKDTDKGTADSLCNDFQTDRSVRAAIVSIALAHVSPLALEAANTVLFAELYWDPSFILQAEAMVHIPNEDSDNHDIYFSGHHLGKHSKKKISSNLVYRWLMRYCFHIQDPLAMMLTTTTTTERRKITLNLSS
ncbi:uncharacterized protein BYT42DRAFT_373553 [Radiomyces spectabilis]|uniref:uncharacterized protein n=1 Tax=Radiomyces spectabilis TaxID=64574 RepID=UPI00221FED0B|nr:uncharacterized protein BYT42DRAFT_373553 [Radiomyces spectabilis]KAI8376070.1 hypothetical protein BYT42DRAFT_373553 [Radiomyces spectabilis]